VPLASETLTTRQPYSRRKPYGHSEVHELLDRMTPERRARVAASRRQAALALVDDSVRPNGSEEPKLEPKQVGLTAAGFEPEDKEHAGN
jgi:hypothetical protein